MALIECSECGKQISDKAKSCPDCGCPVETVTVNPANINVARSIQTDSESVKYDWSWPAFIFIGLWALYKRLWGKFFIAVAVNLVSTITYKICYPVIMIIIADKINDPNTFIAISLLIIVVFMLAPTVLLGVWFGNNGNKWLHNKDICSNANKVKAEPQNDSHSKNIKEYNNVIADIFAAKKVYVAFILVLMLLIFEYVIYKNNVDEYVQEKFSTIKLYATNKYDIIIDYFRYNVIEYCALSANDKAEIDKLTSLILYKAKKDEANEFNSNMTMSDIIRKYNIKANIKTAESVNYSWTNSSGIKFHNKATGDTIYVNDTSVSIHKPDNSIYTLDFSDYVYTFLGGIDGKPRIVRVQYEYRFMTESNKIGHAVYSRIVNKFDKINYNIKSKNDYFHTYYENEPDDNEARVSFTESAPYVNCPAITWSIKLHVI